MSEERKNNQVLRRDLAFEQLDTDERKDQTQQLLNELLPNLAAEIENTMSEQRAILFYEFFTEHRQPKIRIVLKLAKFEHEFFILLDSKNALFVIGSERGGVHASNALSATILVKQLLLKLKV